MADEAAFGVGGVELAGGLAPVRITAFAPGVVTQVLHHAAGPIGELGEGAEVVGVDVTGGLAAGGGLIEGHQLAAGAGIA